MKALPSNGDLYGRCRRLTACGVAFGTALLIAACTESPPAGPNRTHSPVAAATVDCSPQPAPGAPDPCLLPVAAGQAPNVAAYTVLAVPGLPAGSWYKDPVTQVKIWKVTSSSVPASNKGAGHDYADGPTQVSRGWGPGNNTHTLLIGNRVNATTRNFWLVDFTRAEGFNNLRQLTSLNIRDLAFTFSNVPGQERIAYAIDQTDGKLYRYNTETGARNSITTLNTAQPWAMTWLHQDKNDVWFVGLWDDNTAFAWNSQTGTLRTHHDDWLNEPRLERDGRYVGLTAGADGPRHLWDLSLNPPNDTGPLQGVDELPNFSHMGSCRSHWVSTDARGNAPFRQLRYFVSGGQIAFMEILRNSATGNGSNHSCNWIQSNADLGGNLDRQWSYLEGIGVPSSSAFLWNQAIGVQRDDGSDQRLLLHHYSTNITDTAYWHNPWGQPSPDGKVVIFNSNMNGSGRHDLFVAEVPLSASQSPSTQAVVWTSLFEATANGNSITKTAGCQGCAAGGVSSQTITSGDGYVDFNISSVTDREATGLSLGNTDTSLGDIDFAIYGNGGGFAEVYENGAWKASVAFTAATDVFRIESAGGQVRYKKNGTVFYTSSKTPSYPLLLDSSLETLNGGINNAVISGLLN
jgi:hypothetical protein